MEFFRRCNPGQVYLPVIRVLETQQANLLWIEMKAEKRREEVI